MNNFQLLSPIMYFFAGGITEEQIQLIKNIQSKLISNSKGIQYVTSISELPAAHTAFLKTPFNTVGEIRVNFVINMNSCVSKNIDEVIEAAYNFLRLRYTTFVTIDAYCILDESGGDFDIMSVSLNAVNNTLRKKNMLNIVYLLSNINSKGVSSDNYKNIYESIAHMPLVLDCAIIKDMHGGWFDERYFKQLSNESQCYTIGSLILQKPDEAIYNETIINIISYFKEVLPKDETVTEYYVNKLVNCLKINFEINIKIETEDLFAVLENTNKNTNKLDGNTNIELISNTFGDRIDDFFKLNITEHSQTEYSTELNNISKSVKLILDEAAKDPKCGIYGLSRVLSCFSAEIANIKKDYETKHTESTATLESWQKSAAIVHTRTLGLFLKKYKFPYETAYTYIALKTNNLNKYLNISLLNEIITIIQCYSSEIKYKTDTLDCLQSELKSKNQELLSGYTPVITQNFNEYYKNRAYEVIQQDKEYTEQIYSGLSYASAEEIEKTILEYAKNVVESEPFCKSLVEEINARISKNRAIYESGISGKNYNIYLRSGESGKHREICLFTNNPSDFSVYANEQGVSPEFDKLNIMYGLNKNQIILIYMLGVFSTEDLFYRELYLSEDKQDRQIRNTGGQG